MPKESPLANHTIAELQIGEKTGAMVLAIRTSEGRFDTTPSAQDVIRTGDTLIVLGARDQVIASKSSCAAKSQQPKIPLKVRIIPDRLILVRL